MTAGSLDEAERIGRALVLERLAACVNLLPAMQSVYRWDGKLQQEAEVAMLAKTRAELVGRLTERVLEIHSYECPCVVVLPIEGGNPAFLEWVRTQSDGSVEPSS
jgi:periplasmic divalent cation tolerance protein